MKARVYLYLALLTAGAFLVHGYHPYAEDSEFYISAVKKLLNPSLYPLGSQIFERQASLTAFPWLIAETVRVLHLPLDTVLLAGQLLCYFLFLLACWKLSCLCFESQPARWCAVALVAALLTIPVAGTALFLMDQYLNPRSISSFAVLFAVAAALEKRYRLVVLWLIVAGLVHPLMMLFGAAFLFLLFRPRAVGEPSGVVAAALLGLGYTFRVPTMEYDQAALRHAYYFVTHWSWYEWLGIIGPVALLLWFGRIARARRMSNVARLCPALISFVLLGLLGALLLDVPHRLEILARVQPMRSLHLVYVLLLLFAGGLAGEFVLKRSVARWLLLFIPLCAGMTYVQFRLFPVSAHIEWPGSTPRNPWVQAFVWIRQNTPQDAYFALDPEYVERSGEEVQTFLPLAERSALPDEVKDSGSVTLFPELAQSWWRQVSALRGWKHFQLSDFQSVERQFGVRWVVVQQPGVDGLECPYENAVVQVCRVPQAEGSAAEGASAGAEGESASN
ncbi:MAG TPA: hypothetical protein VLW54_06250 [Candidatus Acidoferrales bacterium]|nr:hypothetical protein [Candidatus Acidoferrales bacterium]